MDELVVFRKECWDLGKRHVVFRDLYLESNINVLCLTSLRHVLF